MLLILLTLFVLAPIAEIYVLLTAGSFFGVLPVILACIGTAALGGWIIRLQGLSALSTIQSDLQDGRAPLGAVLDGAFILLAAPFLMTPGFLTDAAGFALLIPFIRKALAQWAWRAIKRRVDRGDATITIHMP